MTSLPLSRLSLWRAFDEKSMVAIQLVLTAKNQLRNNRGGYSVNNYIITMYAEAAMKTGTFMNEKPGTDVVIITLFRGKQSACNIVHFDSCSRSKKSSTISMLKTLAIASITQNRIYTSQDYKTVASRQLSKKIRI